MAWRGGVRPKGSRDKVSRKYTMEERQVLAEFARRELARRNFYDFCKYMDSGFFSDDKPHLKLIADALQEVYEGSVKKLAISLPPRSGKSYTVSLWCAWVLGKKPYGTIMRNSYSGELAMTFSYDVRAIIQSDKYRALFPDIMLKQDRRALEDWALTVSPKSAYFCGGVGGSITGKGANLAAILDDPIKNIEEALSETIINKTWQWYTSTHMSRMESGCPEIHIATRWAKKDPIGRLTDPESEFYNPEYKVIVIPALTPEGKSFCEAVKTTEEYLALKAITDDFIWEAEYMQNPIESKGLLYPVEELNRFKMSDLIGKKPDCIVGYTDTADRGDDFLCSVIGRRYGAYTYITDVVFSQEGVEVTEPLVAQMIIDTKADLMKFESNSGGASFARNVKKILRDNHNYCSIIDEPNTTNKETRILMSSGYVKEYFYFRNDYELGSDYDKFMRQLTSYVRMGKNKHDDAPDAITGLAEYMRMREFGKELPAKKKDHFGIYEDYDDDDVDFGALGGEVTESYINYS